MSTSSFEIKTQELFTTASLNSGDWVSINFVFSDGSSELAIEGLFLGLDAEVIVEDVRSYIPISFDNLKKKEKYKSH